MKTPDTTLLTRSAFTGHAVAEVNNFVQNIVGGYVWEEDNFELVAAAEHQCPWVRQSGKHAQLCWCEMDVGDSTDDAHFVAYIVSCITTSFPVRSTPMIVQHTSLAS
jgi:hypothetical protein